MNIFYCCCIETPWIEVAKTLDKAGYHAKYWIGWPDSEKRVGKELSASYHNINLAWKGLFPEEIKGSSPFPPQLDGIELKNYGYDELIAIRMLERLDRDRESFTFKERQYFFRRLLNDWLYILKHNKIDLIVFPSIPHRGFDYAIYVAAKILNIEFLTFKKTRWQGELIPLQSTFEEIPNLTTPNTTKENQKVKDYIQKILNKNYNDVEPDYMVAQKKDAAKSFTSKLIEKTKKQPSKLTSLFDEFPIHWKKKGKRIEESTHSRAEVYLDEYNGNIYKRKLKEYYHSKCITPDYSKKYILVALHYQPEVNSVPEGNIYGDQLLMVRALLKHTSEDIDIYVKEHVSQFVPKMEGQTGRTKEFYNQLIEYDRVKLISTEIDPFTLIDKAFGVATLIGNICLEALIRKKPVVLFGNAWYQYVHGVLRVTTNSDMKKIMTHYSNYEPDNDLLEQQIQNTIAQSLRANHYKFVAEQSDITTEESILNLVKYIQTNYSL